MSSIDYQEHPGIMLTIEGQLETYTRCRNTTERHKVLWHAWNHNKRWLIQLLEMVMPSFPSYSKHDVSHAEAVLHNIEMLMGEAEIKKLSASDCFLILHVVYIHDIGMCITGDYRRELLKKPEFLRFLENCRSDLHLKEYADILLAMCRDYEKQPEFQGDEEQKRKAMLQMKLKVYYAITYLIAEYRRSDHGKESQRLLDQWIMDNSKLGSGFSTSGIPSRFFYTIGACAGVHTSYDFKDIMKLSKQDGGYTHDFMHPRFAAVLLQLGDALDLDNDRFHPLMKEFTYNIPETSQLHVGKHKAIRRLRISPSKITIHANCEESGELRLVQREYEGIKDILKNATFHWSAICPEELDMVLPELEELVLYLKGRPISAKLVKTKFEIQQEKAFNLLQGSNIYRAEKYVFLREIFQNAIDASKIQFWRDWLGGRESPKEEEMEKSKPDAKNYPTKVEFHLAVKKRYGREIHTLDSRDEERSYLPRKEGSDKDEARENLEYGVLVRVTDCGIGISEKDILSIANLGSTYEPENRIYKKMPGWLQPTAEFGIGLQSVFLVTKFFSAKTHVRNGERYDIEFHATGDKGDGYINVVPVTDDEQICPYGTCFEIFVPNEKFSVKDDREKIFAWEDPMERKGDPVQKSIDQSRKLAVQMYRYLNSLIGEKLFPVIVQLYDYSEEKSVYDPLFCRPEWPHSLEPELIIDKVPVKTAPEAAQDVTWTYKSSKHCLQTNKCEYYFDLKHGCLKVADSEHNIYASVSAARILGLRSRYYDSENPAVRTDTVIYYKGVSVAEYALDYDLNLLEYIDIKGSLDGKYLALNRSEFTQNGERHIREEIYFQVLDALYSAVIDYAQNNRLEPIINSLKANGGDSAASAIPDWLGGKGEEASKEQIHKNVLFLIGLAAFIHTQNLNTYLMYSNAGESARNGRQEWDRLMETLSRFLEKQREIHSKESGHWAHSVFYRLTVYNAAGANYDKEKNLADIVRNLNKYMIVSRRKNVGSQWSEELVKLSETDAEEIKKWILELKTEADADGRNELKEHIEEKAEQLLKSSDRNIEDEVSGERISEQQILVWMLQNLPSLAVFSNRENTLRINVLDKEYTDSMYLSRSLRYAIYEKMADLYQKKGIQRFSTVTFTGFCQLGVETEEDGIYFLKRGKFGKTGRFGRTGRRHLVMPLTGQTLYTLMRWIDDSPLGHFLDMQEAIDKRCMTLFRDARECAEHPDDSVLMQKLKKKMKSEDYEMASFWREIADFPLKGINLPERFQDISADEWQEELDNICESLLWRALQKEENTGEGSARTEEAKAISEIEKWIDQTLIPNWHLLRNWQKDKKTGLEEIAFGSHSEWIELTDKLGQYFGVWDMEKFGSLYTRNSKTKAIEKVDKTIASSMKQKECLKRAKQALIQTVTKDNWLHTLDYNQVETMYVRFIKDIADTLLFSLESRAQVLNMRFGLNDQ